jgi:hypothetical protein
VLLKRVRRFKRVVSPLDLAIFERRKRDIPVDTLGLLLAPRVLPACYDPSHGQTPCATWCVFANCSHEAFKALRLSGKQFTPAGRSKRRLRMIHGFGSAHIMDL